MTAKKSTQRAGFRTGEHIVYPAHGVGRITGVETQEVAGIKLDLFVISFIKDKMTLRVPTAKATSVGMRRVAAQPTGQRCAGRSRRGAAAPGSSAPCGAAARRSTRPRSTPAT